MSKLSIRRMDLSLIKKKFRGCMLGALSGDCLGSPYEGDHPLSAGEKIILQKSFDKLEGVYYKAPVMQYTDDSAMTKCLAESLIEKKNLDLVDVVKKFVKSYYREPNRGYGQSVITVFQKLRANKFTDILKPASEQFNGQGSLGNGGAMRIAPIALFSCHDYDEMIKMTRDETSLTHTHTIAIQQSLELDPEDELDTSEYIDNLIDKMDEIEVEDEDLNIDKSELMPYKHQLTCVKKFMENQNKPTSETVINKLGNDVTAVGSVATAIYCFLRAKYPIDDIHTDNPMRRAIQYAITLGGDTDTIASMAGAIAGAFYGDDKMSQELLRHCEASAEFDKLAVDLFDITIKE
ncbi:hypothetical protein HCN44_006893 [Aphidius gifuensis]|uniref:ADP-ribosylhydrolase ARH3 n=1 Tax=Aphidius gifuensis TaxID=684658 RepID=A0A834XZL7_APHGI|nr:hypothetical protein HCN44_006893 [Aphidius gifuensis]